MKPSFRLFLVSRRFALGSAAFLLAGWAWGVQAAPMCIENGGDYVGCVKPLGMRWVIDMDTSDMDGTQHSSREGASWSR